MARHTTHRRFSVCLLSVCAVSLWAPHQPRADCAFKASSALRAPPFFTEPDYQHDVWGQVAFAPVPRFQINTHDPITQDIYISKSVHDAQQPWDPFLWQLIVDVLAGAPPSLMVDVGANLGYFSLQAAALGHRVVAFEPMGRNAHKFFASIVQNRFESNITLYQNAVTHQSGQVVRLKETHPTNQGNGQIRTGGVREGRYGVDYVETVRLDEVLHEDVLFMKIDVEGFEGAVLNGAMHLICCHRVQYITLEVSSDTAASADFPVVLKRLEDLGYSISDIIRGSPRLNADAYARFPPNILLTRVATPACQL